VTDMNNDKDRREAKRISYICEVECDGDGLRRLATRINDLSMTGAFIDSVTCYSTGTILKLRFRINEVVIETTAEVRYSMPSVGMGVQFLDLKPAHVAALESFIEGKPLVLPPAITQQADEDEQTADGWDMPDMLLGNFAVVSMFDVIQLIENNRLGGELALLSPSASGEILFNDGQIVDANSGSESGLEALKSFLDVTAGTFEFKRSPTNYPRKIEALNNMSLMLDLLRVRDEQAALSSDR
jgi:uncharacterized protein DUF4388/PilZ domain-containing protein